MVQRMAPGVVQRGRQLPDAVLVPGCPPLARFVELAEVLVLDRRPQCVSGYGLRIDLPFAGDLRGRVIFGEKVAAAQGRRGQQQQERSVHQRGYSNVGLH